MVRDILTEGCYPASPRRRVNSIFTDALAIITIVVLNGLLSADNTLVLAILVLGLPRRQQKKALRYGILGAFVFQSAAVFLATYLIQVGWVKVAGGLYLLYLTYGHFFGGRDVHHRRTPPKAKPWMGLTAFWATVVKVELTDLMFALDSILVAVAMSPKRWVIITGLVCGIIVMRLLIGQVLRIVERYPAIVDGAFLIIAWVAIKLFLEYLHQAGHMHFEVPRWFSLGLIVVIFAVAYIYARQVGPISPEETLDDEAAALIERTKRES